MYSVVESIIDTSTLKHEEGTSLQTKDASPLSFILQQLHWHQQCLLTLNDRPRNEEILFLLLSAVQDQLLSPPLSFVLQQLH